MSSVSLSDLLIGSSHLCVNIVSCLLFRLFNDFDFVTLICLVGPLLLGSICMVSDA